MKKKWIALVMALVMVTTSLPTPAIYAQTAHSKIETLQQKQIIVGRGDGGLQLDEHLTRAEAVKLLVHASGMEGLTTNVDTNRQHFKDVPANHWAFKYIELMKNYQMVAGMPDGNFYPNADISYEEMVALIVRLDKDFPGVKEKTAGRWSTPYLSYAKDKNLLDGVTMENSKNPSIRRDIFYMIYNALPFMENNNRLRDVAERPVVENKREQKNIPELIWEPASPSIPTPAPTPTPDKPIKPEVDPGDNDKPSVDPGKNDTPEMKTARKFLGQFIDKAKSLLKGLTPSDETDPKKIDMGEVVAKHEDIATLQEAIKAAEAEFNNPNATLKSLEKAKGEMEQASIDFKTVEGEKPIKVIPYEKEDIVTEGNVIKGLTDQGKEKLKRNKNILVIPAMEGVEDIADNAFANVPIKVLEIDGSIKTIGSNAFLKCGISKLTLHDGLEHVKARAFSNNNMKTVSVPGTLNDVEANGFANSNIVNLTFEEGVRFIGDSAFTSNAISNIKFPTTLKQIDLGAFKSNLMTAVDFPNGLEEISPKIFCRNKITEVTVPNSLKVFCGNSFRYNPGFEGDTIFKMYLKDPVEIASLDGMTIEDKLSEVVQLRPYIFKGQLKDEKTPLGIESWELIERQGDVSTYSAKFEQISDEKLDSLLGDNKKDGTSNETVQENLKKIRLIVKVKISNDVLGIWDADDFTVEGNKITGFTDKGKKRVATDKNMVIPAIDGVDTIAKSAFRNSRTAAFDLESVEIPKNIKAIEMAAFGANPIEKVRFNEGLETIGSSAFMAHHIKELQLPDSLKSVGNMAFMGDRKNPTLEKLDLGKNLESIGRNAFMNGNLSELELNENLKKIDVNAFSGNQLTSVKFNTGLQEIGCNAFANNQLTKVNLPLSIQKVCATAFDNNDGIEVIIGNRLGVKGMTADEIKAMLKEKVTTKVGYGKNGDSIAEIENWEIDGDIAKPVLSDASVEAPFVIKLDAHFDKGSDQDIDDDYQGVPWTPEDFVVEDSTITGISDSAKDKLATSNRVTIPAKDAKGNKITKIAPNLFGRNASDPDNTKIKELVIEDGIEEIGSAAFRNNLIEEVVIPDSVKIIGVGAFSNNNQLKKLTLPKNIKEIAPSTFFGTGIEELVIPEGVTKVGMRAFSDCMALKTLSLPNTLETIGGFAFQNTKNLQTVEIPGNVKVIGRSAFSHSGLINLTLNEGIEEIGIKAFQYNNILKVIIPKSVKKLDDSAFEDNASIEIIR